MALLRPNHSTVKVEVSDKQYGSDGNTRGVQFSYNCSLWSRSSHCCQLKAGRGGKMGGEREIKGGGLEEVWCTKKNGRKMAENAPNFPIITVFTAPTFHIFSEGLTENWRFPLWPN